VLILKWLYVLGNRKNTGLHLIIYIKKEYFCKIFYAIDCATVKNGTKNASKTAKKKC